MSLFPSSFESKASVSTPSISLSAKGGKNAGKRKRNDSLANHEAAQQVNTNLEKLMKKFDGGQVREKDEGNDRMGHIGKKTSKKPKGNGNGSEEKVHEVPKGKGTQAKGKGKAAAPAREEAPPAKKSKPVKSAFDKPEPVQLPIPSLPKSTGEKLKVGGEGALTDMQKNMQSKLEGARFRWINEQLYSTPSTEAVAMMKADPKIFADYHETHRLLTAAWPNPPLPYIIKLLTSLSAGTVIADLGCGDAGLARALVPQGKVVLSYDLVGDNGVPGSEESEKAKEKEAGGWVVQADFLDHIPLPGRPGGLQNYASYIKSEDQGKKKKGKKGKRSPDASEIVDVVVCCLSLMGTNWVAGISEACRVLKQGGTFHIAEVTSRFVSTEDFVGMLQSFGFDIKGESQPSTHFTLFSFTKASELPLGPVKGQKGWRKRVAEGEGILKGCVYKKR